MNLEDRRESKDRLLEDQSNANEKLVIATIRAEEAAESARDDARHAEGTTHALRANEVELLETAEFRERMIGMLGHDLRNPLNAISLGAELLVADGRLADNDAKILKRIVTSSARMSHMISELLDFTRARLGGGFALLLARADLSEICQGIIDELRDTSAIEIVQTENGNVTGFWDAGRLAEVVSNIVGNAIGFATPGTSVAVDLRDEGERVVLSITNIGVSITPALLRDIFLPFRRSREASIHRSGHLGLGLYIAHEIVNSHGGTLDVRSADGSTTFTASLPRESTPQEALVQE
jgi:signal transduction histidine kinase